MIPVWRSWLRTGGLYFESLSSCDWHLEVSSLVSARCRRHSLSISQHLEQTSDQHPANFFLLRCRQTLNTRNFYLADISSRQPKRYSTSRRLTVVQVARKARFPIWAKVQSQNHRVVGSLSAGYPESRKVKTRSQ